MSHMSAVARFLVVHQQSHELCWREHTQFLWEYSIIGESDAQSLKVYLALARDAS